MRSQRGASLAVVILVLAILVASLLAIRSLTRTTDRAGDREATVATMAKAQSALEQFAAVNHRLPCPADPAANTGLEAPVGGSQSCTTLAGLGTLPWKTLGLRDEDGLDAWGLKISYVPYTGIPNSGSGLNVNAGSLTQAEGISMTNCDTVVMGPVDSNGLCMPDHSTGDVRFLQEPGFGQKTLNLGGLLGGLLGGVGLGGIIPPEQLLGKGKKVQEPNVPQRQDAAYVLVSHGLTGLGAFDRNGVQRLPQPSNDHEKQNAAPVPSNMTNQIFYKEPFSNLDIAGTDNNHFDDIVVFTTVRDLVNHIGLQARQWAVQGQVAYAAFNRTTLGTSTPGSLGPTTTSVTVGTVTAATLTGGQTLGLGTVTTSSGDVLEGIGIATANNAALSSATPSLFGLNFPRNVRSVGFTLAGFDSNTLTTIERVRFTFYDNAFPPHVVGSQITKAACHPTGYTTFSVTASVDFRSVQVEPLSAVNILGLNSGASSFLVSEAIACDSTASTCPTPIARSDSTTGC